MSRFNQKKGKSRCAFARITPGGQWHVVTETKVLIGPGKYVPGIYLHCRVDDAGDRRVRKTWLHGFHRSLTGFIFTKPHKICGTCKKMKVNRHLMKSAGFDL